MGLLTHSLKAFEDSAKSSQPESVSLIVVRVGALDESDMTLTKEKLKMKTENKPFEMDGWEKSALTDQIDEINSTEELQKEEVSQSRKVAAYWRLNREFAELLRAGREEEAHALLQQSLRDIRNGNTGYPMSKAVVEMSKMNPLE